MAQLLLLLLGQSVWRLVLLLLLGRFGASVCVLSLLPQLLAACVLALGARLAMMSVPISFAAEAAAPALPPAACSGCRAVAAASSYCASVCLVVAGSGHLTCYSRLYSAAAAAAACLTHSPMNAVVAVSPSLYPRLVSAASSTACVTPPPASGAAASAAANPRTFAFACAAGPRTAVAGRVLPSTASSSPPSLSSSCAAPTAAGPAAATDGPADAAASARPAAAGLQLSASPRLTLAAFVGGTALAAAALSRRVAARHSAAAALLSQASASLRQPAAAAGTWHRLHADPPLGSGASNSGHSITCSGCSRRKSRSGCNASSSCCAASTLRCTLSRIERQYRSDSSSSSRRDVCTSNISHTRRSEPRSSSTSSVGMASRSSSSSRTYCLHGSGASRGGWRLRSERQSTSPSHSWTCASSQSLRGSLCGLSKRSSHSSSHESGGDCICCCCCCASSTGRRRCCLPPLHTCSLRRHPRSSFCSSAVNGKKNCSSSSLPTVGSSSSKSSSSSPAGALCPNKYTFGTSSCRLNFVASSSGSPALSSRASAFRSGSGRSVAAHPRSCRRSFSSSRGGSSSSKGGSSRSFFDETRSFFEEEEEQQQQRRLSRVRLAAPGLLRLPDLQVQPLQVVLVGRPNVGKSTLFNRLLSGTRPSTDVRRRLRRGSAAAAAIRGAPALQANCHVRREQLLQQAIVSPQAGTTRDRRIARAVFGGLQLLLVDTGGLEDKETTEASQLLTHMRKQVRVALCNADCVLFVVDAKEGITPVDELLARLVRDWLAGEEQRRRQQQQQRGQSGGSGGAACSEAAAAAAAVVITTVRAAEKRAGGRLAMQQHQSGGRRLLLLPGQPHSPSAATQAAAAAAAGALLEEPEARIACGEAARGPASRAPAAGSAARRAAAAPVANARSESPTAAACAARAADAAAAEEGWEAAAAPLVDATMQDCTVPVILVANKGDGCFLGAYLSDCYELGLGSPVIVSAKKNEGLDDLYDRLLLEIGHRQRALETEWQPTANAEDGLEERQTGAARWSSREGEETGASSGEPADSVGRDATRIDGETERQTIAEGGRLSDEDNKYIRERVLQAPRPSGEADCWLEGLVRRYSKCGLSESYNQLRDPASSMHLPWDLSCTCLAAAARSEAPAASLPAAAGAADGHEAALVSTAAAADAQETAKVTAATAEWRRASAGALLPVEDELVSLRNRRSKLKTKEGRDRLLSLKRQLLYDETIHLAVIGRPNVGKSTLVNALLQQERMIVSDEPGTTTDSIAVEWEYKRHPFCLIDTSGVTRGWKMKHTDLLLEAGAQTLRNIRRAQVCILCVDGSAAESSGVAVSAHELSLAHLATTKEGRCLVVCITKWDLVLEQERERVRKEVLERLQTGLGHLKNCPIVFTAAKHGHNLDTLMNRVLLLYRRWNARIPTSKLNAWLQQFLLHFPPPWRLGSRCQIKYLTQVKARPPTFVAWSNVYSAFPVNYQRQLQNALREEFTLGGIPIRFIMRTTAKLPTGKKLSKKELLKWRRKTHKTRTTASKFSKKTDNGSDRSTTAETAVAH